MPVQTKVTIKIGRQEIHKFSKLVIDQKVNAHHKFSIVIPISLDSLSGAFDKAREFVGCKTLITITPTQFGVDNKLEFRGSASEIKLIKAEGNM
ncbi:MAG: hypothetical protein ACK5IC_04150, partial [Moheibacter sp.]